jgi:hypothetical protein
MPDGGHRIGRVTRCSIRGFVGGIQVPEPDMPTFGSFCTAEAQRGRSQVVGLIYDISIEDDELARQLAVAEAPAPEARADNQFTRPMPIEIQALSVGYRSQDEYHYHLPPQPPLTLADIFPLPAAEVRRFTEQLDFLALILSAAQLPVDDLLVAALATAADARPESERRAYRLRAGRECARLLGHDLNRLEKLIRLLGDGARRSARDDR